jgi:hypothetical protein
VKLEDAAARLRLELQTVRRRFDEGADDWQFSLLRTIREYFRVIEIGPELLMPLESFLLEIGDESLRRREPPAPGQPRKPLGEALALTIAAAAVTVMKSRGSTVAEAERAVARVSGIPARKLRSFRNSILSATATPVAVAAYPSYVEEVASWPTLDGLSLLKGYVK